MNDNNNMIYETLKELVNNQRKQQSESKAHRVDSDVSKSIHQETSKR